MSFSILRRASLFVWLATFVLMLPLWAQDAPLVTPDAPATQTTITVTQSAPKAQNAPREGTPSFLGAVDTTLRTWHSYFSKYSIYLVLAVGALFAYLTGLVVYQLATALGSFAPKAGAIAAWFSAMAMLVVFLMLMPIAWPWWSPYVMVFCGIAMTAVLISTLSKKAV